MALRAACGGVIASVAAAVSRSGLASNVIGIASDKGQATATQNYSYEKLWMSPWVRAMTEMTQNSLDAGARNQRIVLLDATKLTERDAYKDPLLLTYAEDDGKGMRVSDFIKWFQQYGGSGKRSSGGMPTAGGLGDGNTFTVHGARCTVVRSSNFLSIIQASSAVHLCAGCGFALPRAQVRGEGANEWCDVTLPCIREGCGLRCCDGMEATQECPSELCGHDKFPALADLVRRAHAAGEGLAEAASADPALALVCTKCWGFHARVPLPDPPANDLFVKGLQMLVEHEPATIRDYRSYWSVERTHTEARASWLQFVPPALRSTLRVRTCAMELEAEQGQQGQQGELLDYPPPAQLVPLWHSPRMAKQGETWAVLSKVQSDGEDLDKRYLRVLMNSLLVHKIPLYVEQEHALVLNVYSTAPPSVYTTSNRGSIEGPLKPLIADLISELRGEGLRAPDACFLLEFKDIVATAEASEAPVEASEASEAPVDAPACAEDGASSSSSSGLAEMLDATTSASAYIKEEAVKSKGTQRMQVVGSLRAALEGSALAFLAGLMRKMEDPAFALSYMEDTVLPALLSHVRAKQHSTSLASMQNSLSAEDARAIGLASRFAEAVREQPWEPETHELLASLQRFPAEASEGEGAEAWFPPLLVNDTSSVRVPLGISYGNLSNGTAFVLRLYRSALDMTLTASLKHSRLSWRVPKAMRETQLRVGLLLQNMGLDAYRGPQRFAALTPSCAPPSGGGGGGAALLASAGLCARSSETDQDSHTLACLHLPSQTFCVDAGYVLSARARLSLGLTTASLKDSYDESAMCPDSCATLLLPLALHEFAHALCDGADHDEEYAGVLTALTTSAMAERVHERLVKQAKIIKSELADQRASAIQLLRGLKRPRGAEAASSGTKKARKD